MSTSPSQTIQETSSPLKTTPIHVKGILAATDLSEQATVALKVAARLAKKFHSRLHLLYTVSPQPYVANTAPLLAEMVKIDIERGQEELHAYTSKIAEVRTTRHEEITLCGPAIDAIAELVPMKGIDLLVMGSHGRAGLRKMIMGSVAEAAVRQLSCPVIVAGPKCKPVHDTFHSIVFATDLPVGSLRAAQYASSLALQTGASLTIAHILPAQTEDMGYVAKKVKENAVEELRLLIPGDPQSRKHFYIEVATGHAAPELTRIAKHHKADWIVMGTREHTTLADHAPWATLSAVIRDSHCPVLVVPPHFLKETA